MNQQVNPAHIAEMEELKSIKIAIEQVAKEHANRVADEFVGMCNEFAKKQGLPLNIAGVTPVQLLHRIGLGERAAIEQISQALTQQAVKIIYEGATRKGGLNWDPRKPPVTE